ncbi:peptide MFS transporter [Streptomyces sp. YC504]|uniref:Peptide MFS transporter n=1 Tax=Streptomyces mesophilus TaxID=1775132 RepID=A0A6G4XQD2_9ACTN|nr:peptide MFS transporter [Streptomyces mesophilus]NGO79799.1 peptide MFS transporter [Streptomyces mesophilus]
MRNFSTPGKFSLALGLTGGSFLVMAVASAPASGGAKVFPGQGVLLVVAGLLMRKGSRWLRTQIGEHEPGEAGVRVAV